MSSTVYARIRSNPQFTEMVRRREGFAWKLSAIVFIVFYGFVMAVAFAPDLIALRPFRAAISLSASLPVCFSSSFSGY